MPLPEPRHQPPADAATRGVIPRRLAAWCLDVAAMALLGWGLLGGTAGLLLAGLGPMAGMLLPAAMLLPLAYGTLSIASPLSTTPGQAVLGLVVRSEDGGHPALAQAFTATLVYTLSWATGGLAFLAALFSTRKRTLHDLFSGTVVVRAGALRQAAREQGWERGTLADG